MKIKKVFLPIIALLSLTSCGTIDYAGNYQFQLGKSTGTHFGIYMSLTNEAKEDDPSLKKFTLDADFGQAASANESDKETINVVRNAFSVKEENVTSSLITGYYSIGADKLDGYKELILEIEKLYDIDIPLGVIKDVIVSTINDSSLSLYIPVSKDDLIFQLYWYGYEVEEEGKITPTWKGEAGHEAGTHPDAEFIKKIQTGDGDESKAWSEYRDYYTLNMGLIKVTE